MRKLLPLCAAGGLFAGEGVLAPAWAESSVQVFENTEYYDIKGRTGRTLIAEMREKGPPALYELNQSFGATSAYTKWRAYFVVGDEGCSVDEVEISIDITYYMPRWSNREKGRKRLQKTWDDFISALWVHEKGHGEIARRGGVLLIDQFEAIGTRETCDAILEEMRVIFEETQENVIDPAQQRFDMLIKERQELHNRLARPPKAFGGLSVIRGSAPEFRYPDIWSGR